MSAPACTIVLHVAGDVPHSPDLSSSLFASKATSSPLRSSPSMSSLSSFASSPCSYSLPDDGYLVPPGGIPRPRQLKVRKWYRGRRLRPAYTPVPGDAPDQHYLLPTEYPNTFVQPLKPSASVQPVKPSASVSPMRSSALPTSYGDPRTVPIFETAAFIAAFVAVVPVMLLDLI